MNAPHQVDKENPQTEDQPVNTTGAPGSVSPRERVSLPAISPELAVNSKSTSSHSAFERVQVREAAGQGRAGEAEGHPAGRHRRPQRVVPGTAPAQARIHHVSSFRAGRARRTLPHTVVDQAPQAFPQTEQMVSA